MQVEVVIEEARWAAAGLEALASRAASAVTAHLGLGDGPWEVAVLGADDGRIAALNLAFRGRAAPTNVLSWPSQTLASAAPGVPPQAPAPDAPDGPTFLGDIALAYGTCAAEAEAAGRTLADHTTHLVVHGMLHLLGYDHEDDADAALMERLEVEVLASLGVANPY